MHLRRFFRVCLRDAQLPESNFQTRSGNRMIKNADNSRAVVLLNRAEKDIQVSLVEEEDAVSLRMDAHSVCTVTFE